MSLIPYLLDDFNYFRPSHILDQHFGLGLTPEDLLTPISLPQTSILLRRPSVYYRPWRTLASKIDAGSTVNLEGNKFQVNLDVQQFDPKEITVKVSDENTITVEGKHEEKKDEHGYISRHFVRRYVVPKGHDLEKVTSSLSSDGVLTITAPRVDSKEVEHRDIPITQTGQPSKPIEKKSEKMETDEKENDTKKK